MAVYEPHGVHELLFMADQHQMIGAMIGRHYKRCCQADISRFYDQMLRLVRTRTGYRRFHRPARRVPHVDLRYNLARLKLNVCHLQDRADNRRIRLAKRNNPEPLVPGWETMDW